jgi:hypothetical protein
VVKIHQMSIHLAEYSMKNPQRAHDLLQDLLDLLSEQGEKNWRRGVAAALLELTDAGGQLNPAGFDSAASIYRSMTTGGRGFAEYFVWMPDDDERIRANQRLDELRDALWEVFA